MKNGACGTKPNVYEANLCGRLSVELHGNLVTLQLHHFLARKTQNDC